MVGTHDRLIMIFTCDAAIPLDVMDLVRTLDSLSLTVSDTPAQMFQTPASK